MSYLAVWCGTTILIIVGVIYAGIYYLFIKPEKMQIIKKASACMNYTLYITEQINNIEKYNTEDCVPSKEQRNVFKMEILKLKKLIPLEKSYYNNRRYKNVCNIYLKIHDIYTDLNKNFHEICESTTKSRNDAKKYMRNITHMMNEIDDPIKQCILEEQKKEPVLTYINEIKELARVAEEQYNMKKYEEVKKTYEKIRSMFSIVDKRTKEACKLKKYRGTWMPYEKAVEFLEIEFGIAHNFSSMNPFEFERFVARLFKKMGYRTTVTKGSGDFGVDVIAEKYNEKIVIQVKKWEHSVPPGEINKLLGAMLNFRANKAIFVTTSQFTKSAKK